MKKTKLFLGIVLLLSILPIASAKANKDFQQWNALIMTGEFAESDYLYWLEGQARFGENVRDVTQTFFRVALGKNMSKQASLWFGYGLFYTGVPLASPSTTEQRLWQQLIWTTTAIGVSFTSRTRLEQRFFENNENLGWRFREAIRAQKHLPFGDNLYLAIADEFFINLRDPSNDQFSPGFDQNRFYVGFGHKFSQKLMVDIGYLHQNIRRENLPDFIANIISLNAQIKFS